jgi:hypothetical protein
MIHTKNPPAVGADGLLGNVSFATELPQEAEKPVERQIKFRDQPEAEFDPDIALDLAASHWRVAALFLHLTAKYAQAGDYLSLDRNRSLAREQFLEGNLVYKQLQEARAAAAAWIGAEAFRDIEPIDRGRRAAGDAGMSVLPIDSVARP